MTSFTRINRSALSELIVHRKTHIISMILLGISGLAYTGTTMYSERSINLNPVSLFFFFVALVPLFAACINCFKDMHDVPTADVQMAMPLSSAERFFSKLMTICYLWIFPYIVFHGIGNIASVFFERINFTNGYDYYESMYYELVSVPEMFSANIKVFLWGLSIVLFIVGTTVLCASCIGSKAESVYLPIILMVVISVLPAATKAFIDEKFAGTNIYANGTDYFHALGFGAAFYDIDKPSSVLWVLFSCLISVIMLAAALFAYKKRDAVTVGYPIVYRIFFETTVICSLAVLFELAHASSYGVSVITLFIIYVGSVILRMIVSRKDISVLKVLKWSGMFAAYYVIFIIYSYAACMTTGFGCTDHHTDTSEISLYSPIVVNCYHYDYTSDRRVVEHYIAIDEIEKIEKLGSKYLAIQNRTPGYFSQIMFTGLDRNKYSRCSIRIDATFKGREYSTDIYMSNFYLNRESIDNLYDEIESF